MRLRQQAPRADQHFVRPVWFLRSTSMQTLGPLTCHVIFGISMMRSQERTAIGVQHFMRHSFIPVTELCANVQAFEHACNFGFRFDATS